MSVDVIEEFRATLAEALGPWNGGASTELDNVSKGRLYRALDDLSAALREERETERIVVRGVVMFIYAIYMQNDGSTVMAAHPEFLSKTELRARLENHDATYSDLKELGFIDLNGLDR